MTEKVMSWFIVFMVFIPFILLLWKLLWIDIDNNPSNNSPKCHLCGEDVEDCSGCDGVC